MEEDAPLFSLVMCLFDVESYVGEAVSALRAQTFEDWELIIVDDAAHDRSVLRALRAAKGDGRIRIVHNNANLGLEASRNRGLSLARGRYVAFPDAEDRPEPDYLAVAAEAVAAEDPDIVVEGVVEDYFNHRGNVAFSEELKAPAGVYEGDGVDRLMLPLGVGRLIDFVFTKFFRRSMVGDTRFEVGPRHYSEDFFFVLEMMERARKVVVVDRSAYRFEKHIRNQRNLTFTEGTFLESERRVAALQLHQQEHGLDCPDSRRALGAVYGRAIMDEAARITEQMSDVPKADRVAWMEQVKEGPLYQELILQGGEPEGFIDSHIHRALLSDDPKRALRLGHLIGYLKSFGPESWARTQP